MANRYWFRSKSYGYGAVPSSWEGWALVFAFAVVVAASAFVVASTADRMSLASWIGWFALLALATGGVIYVSWKKTDGDWRWRGGGKGWFN